MITHDVDEAIYLADRIVLMTNGPGAVLAEIVDNPLPKERVRTDIHKHPLYYAVRNHIIDFLVSRSKTFAGETRGLRSAQRAGRAAGRRADHRDDRDAVPRARTPCGRSPRTDDHNIARTGRNTMKREDLTEKLLDIKREKGWTWKHICERDRRHVAGDDHRRRCSASRS